MIILFAALTILLALTEGAHALPIGGLIVGALGIAGTVGGTILAAAINLGVALGASYIARSFQKKPESPQVGGVNGAIGTSGVRPCSFIAGRWATAGSLTYVGTWGTDGKTPNAMLVYCIALSDIACKGLIGVFANGEEITYNPAGTPHADGRGIAIPEYTVGGKEHLWVKFIDGSNISAAADTYLRAKFGSHAERPYTADMFGRGISYAIVTCRVNSELFSGFPAFKFVVDGVRMYDIREDTSAGGSGTQDWDDVDTWSEAPGNPAVIAYNIERGVRDGYGNWFFGGQTFTAYQFPYDSWAAGANECDVDTDTVSGSEPQYVAGCEVDVSQPPMDYVENLMMACNGRVAEVGGRYRIHVGAATAAVLAFTDDSIIVTEDQVLEPFIDLDSTVNGISGRYIEPAEGWEAKAAPDLFSTEFEAEDGGRRLVAAIDYNMVVSVTQTQRLMKSARDESRRQRRHTLFLPPEAWPVEPLDIVTWTSTRNGYVSKKFRVDRVSDRDNLDVEWYLTEVDPADYDWDPNADEQDTETVPIIISRPAAQPIVDWTVDPYTLVSPSGSERAAILLGWDPDVDDVNGVQFEVRLKSTAELVLEGQTDRWEVGSIIISQNILPSTTYEARGRYRPDSPRETSWSSWLEVTTPADVITSEIELTAELDQVVQRVLQLLPQDLFIMRSQIHDIEMALTTITASVTERIGRVNLGVGSRYGENKATADAALIASTTANSALAAFLVNLFTTTADGESEGLIRFIAATTASGAVASFAIEVRASFDDEFSQAGLYIDVGAFPNGATSRIRLLGEQIYFENPVTGLVVEAFLLAVAGAPVNVPISSSVIRADMANHRPIYRTEITADCELQFPDNALPGLPYRHILMQDAVGGHTVTLAPELVGSPDISQIDLVGTVLDITITDLDPDFAIVTKLGEYTLDPSFAVRGTYNDANEVALITMTPVGGVGTAQGQAGELMIIGTTTFRSIDSPQFIPPVGWNIIDTVLSTGIGMALMWKRLDGSETDPISFWGAAYQRQSVHALRLRGGINVIYAEAPEGGDIRSTGGGTINTTDQTLDLSPLTAPVVAIGLYCGTNTSHTETFTPTADGTLVADADDWDSRMRYLITNEGTPSDVVVDQSGSTGGSNPHAIGVLAGYIKG